jgi:hypothetical protein
MMNHPDCAFGYSQARLQARFGARPGAADWQRVDAARDVAALLQTCGATSLAPWTHELTTRMTAHEAERKLRAQWLARVDEVAAWQPSRWRNAIAWLRWLPYLPALEKLARGGQSPDWMRNDPVLGPIVAEDPRQRASSLARTEFAPLAAGFTAPPDVTQAWLAHWRALWPRDAARAPALERLMRQVAALRDELASAPPGTASASLLARLERRLIATFRRYPLSASATIAFLGLAALDLLHLRGAVALHALRPDGERAP